MKIGKFTVTLASLPDRERLVAEIAYENVQWAEISQEKDIPLIQFYPHPRKKYWEFPLSETISILEKAKKELLGEV